MSAVRREERGEVLVITLDRPAARNAIDEELSLGLAAALDELDARADLRVGVVTGAGDTFCAGMDLKVWPNRPRAEAAVALDRLVHRTSVKPVIGAVEGAAVGGGLELLATFDLIAAARTARFALPEVRWSLVPSGAALVHLPERLPRNVVAELALTGEQVTAERLYELGFVTRLTGAGAALGVAVAIAEKIAANGPLAVTAIKRVLSSPDGLAAEREAVAAVNESADAAEGVRAFVEKRPPRYTR